MCTRALREHPTHTSAEISDQQNDVEVSYTSTRVMRCIISVLPCLTRERRVGHSGSNLINPMLQDNVVIGSGIFHYIYHVGCAFNLHSIINNALIPGGQDLSRRQTVFFLPTDPRDENHKYPENVDFSVPRGARYVHSAWKRHQDAVFWVDIDLAIKEGLTFYQTRSNAIIPQEHFLPIAFQKLKD